MASHSELAQYLGQVIPVTFDPTLLVLSYIISLVGATTTLELIHRRTSRRGYYNKYAQLYPPQMPLLLFGAAVTMGGVAIWCMHFIGNRATILSSGEPELQIAYSVGVTVASFFVPVFVLVVAFFVVTGASGNNYDVSWWRVTTSGTLSGGAICGMHYLGNASISNYRCDYAVAFVIGSVIIAVVASTVALFLFFVFQRSWTNSWWKRIGCAVVLAGAVSGMHWCGVMGTKYTLVHVNSTSDLSSRNTTVIGRNVRTGIELVDEEGHIIDNYDTIFCELFCVAASALARQMDGDLAEAGVLWDEILSTGGQTSTGSISQASTSTRGTKDLDDLAEKGIPANRRNKHGHLMFLVRRVGNSHVDHLAASGYCFADPHQVSHIIRSKMQIRTSKLEEKLRGMSRYAHGNMLEPGVHVGLFAVKTQVHQMGFSVLVRRQARNLLPSMELPLDRLESAHLEFLRKFDGMTLNAVLRLLERTNEIPSRDANFAGFLLDAVRNLRVSVQDPFFDNAKLVAKPSQVPCTPPGNDARPSTCSLIAFTIMIPIHVRVDAPVHDFIPLGFFKTQQLVYKNSPHNAAFARSVHRKISPVLDSVTTEGILPPSNSRLRNFVTKPGLFLFSGSHRARTLTPMRPRNAVKLVSPSREHMALTPCDESVASLTLYGANGGETDMVPDIKDGSAGLTADPAKPMPRRQLPPKLSFGGIMISQEVTVDVEEARKSPNEVPDMPSSAHRRDSSNGIPGFPLRQKSQRVNEQGIELREVSNVLGGVQSKVEVKKAGDDAVTTFVDDLFSSCIDTPRRM
ncbi:hypothetical protein N0V88_008059 [Collariella sp. IMI 366227]|nr:hypothetical protein N0V88_008059 [Collariella sp. IMI 366227]